ncbi:PPOX class F420-dependent oxidoreductase [Baekduia soli]|uniref:PPOX class F420-dependent oxidoreductase n=1 Tax=Baekduia soli TaxID=496014 RepID=A0A5B8U200_9ACTN|nr:pyridoxamine 5'-phosphate oxidase family protein [Baekduia soli]QEC47074.1 PPOX class F420-dependent oxidoreductase [Baekduia soli]
MFDPGVRALLEGVNFVHLSTLMKDGSPHSTVVWGHTRGDQAIFFTNNPQSLKGRNIARDPRVALSMIDRDNPYRTGMLRGRVVGTLTGDEADAIVDAMSHKYVGRPFPMRGNTVYLIDVASSRLTELPFEDSPA